MEKLAKTLKAVSDINRIRILKMLEKKELCVCEISSVLQLANSTVSQHLSILKEAGLITDEKDGKWVNYRLVSSPESTYNSELMPLLKKWLADEQIIRSDLKKLETANRNQLCG